MPNDTLTSAQAEKKALRYLEAQAHRAKLAQEIKEMQARAAQAEMDDLTELDAEIAGLSDELRAFVEPWLDKQTRSITVGAARIGLRTSEAVEFKSRCDEDTVIDALKAVIELGTKARASQIAQRRATWAAECIKSVVKFAKAEAKKLFGNSDPQAVQMLNDCGLKLVINESLQVAHAA